MVVWQPRPPAARTAYRAVALAVAQRDAAQREDRMAPTQMNSRMPLSVASRLSGLLAAPALGFSLRVRTGRRVVEHDHPVRRLPRRHP